MPAVSNVLKASDLMIDFIHVPPGNSIQDTLKIMFKNHISGVLVLANGRLKGVATLKDFVVKVPWGKKSLSKVKISEIMTNYVLTVHPEDEVKQAVDLIYHRDIRLVPVVSEQVVKGIITRNEILSFFTGKSGQRYKVRDLMTYRFTTVTFHDRMEDVLEKMLVYGVKYFVVINDEKVVGVMTLTDVLNHFYKLKEGKCIHTVREVMNPNPIVTREDERCDKIARTMIKYKITTLPVVEESGQLEGLIRVKGFLKVFDF